MLLPFATIQIVMNTQAFWTTLCGYLINGEMFMRIEMVGIVACFFGVLLMATAAPSEEDGLQVSHAARIAGFLLMVFVAANDGMVAVLARKMKNIHFSVVIWWFSLSGCLLTMSAITVKSLVKGQAPDLWFYTGEQFAYLFGAGLTSAISLNCATIAFQNDKSTTVSLLAYIELVYAFVCDIFMFGASFTALELVGTGIITFFNILTIVERGRVEKRKEQKYQEVAQHF